MLLATVKLELAPTMVTVYWRY